MKEYKDFYNSGQLRIRCFYKKQKTKIEKVQDAFNGEIMFSNISRVKMDGKCTEYYESGKIHKKCFYKDGILHGKFQCIRSTRNNRKPNKLSIMHFKDGILFGQHDVRLVKKNFSIS